MTREEAIITLTNTASLLRDGTRYMKSEHERQFREAYEMAIKALEQPEQRWIPVTEGLPEEDDYKSCIECLDGAVWYFTENGTMGLGYYYESVKEWSTTNDLKTDGKVVAWMQLPEPYGGEQG